MAEVTTRSMVYQDKTRMLEIESDCFENNFWSWEVFASCMRARNHICNVAEIKNYPIGFLIYSLEQTEIVMHNLAVCPVYQRMGVATKLLKSVKNRFSLNDHYEAIYAETLEENLPAQLFLRSAGFRCEKIVSELEHWDRDVTVYQFVFTSEISARVNRIKEYLP